jgi:hypothetical protein
MTMADNTSNLSVDEQHATATVTAAKMKGVDAMAVAQAAAANTH